jgi:ribose transport system substrate-binding protein
MSRENGRPARNAASRAQYRVGTLEKGLSVLEILEKGCKPLTIQEIANATGIQRAAVFRLLYTLEQRGYVQRQDNKKYRSTTRRRRILLGYAAPLSGTWFRTELAASLQAAAADANVDLVVMDNREDDPEASLGNAQALIDARVDVALLFQPFERIGHTVADRFFHAGIPFISIEVPLQGGIYFGANNYQAGKMAGLELAKFAARNWNGRFDYVVLLESSLTSTNVQARLAGVLVGLREMLGEFEDSRVIHLDGRAHQESSREAVAELLPRLREGARLLISGFNDPTAVGALEAVRAAGRERHVAIVGQNATEESRGEIRNPDSRLIASVAYFPERYGGKLVRLALGILNREPVPPAVYTDHAILSRENIDRYYGAARGA